MKLLDRSYLYNVEPAGTNSPNIEALSSYIVRLSNIHTVSSSTLITKMIFPYLNRIYFVNTSKKGGDGFYKSSNAINGNGRLARDFKQVMQVLTNRDDLINTTLLRFEELFPNKRLLNSKKAWCPQCFYSMSMNQTIYEPLLWSFSIVKACALHKILLVDHCPYCRKTLNYLSRNSQLGYCSCCQSWLGSEENIDNALATNQQLQCTKFISDLIYWSISEKKLYSHDHIVTSLKFFVEKFFNNSISSAANKLGLSETSLRYWLKGTNRPTIETVANLCISIGITFEDFINLNITKIKSLKEIICINRGDKQVYNHNNIKQFLDRIIREQTPLSIKSIASIIGCDRKLISRTYPLECSKIIENNNVYNTVKRVERYIKYYSLIEKALQTLLKKNEYPSYRKMEKILGEKVLREEAFRELFKMLRQRNLQKEM